MNYMRKCSVTNNDLWEQLMILYSHLSNQFEQCKYQTMWGFIDLYV